jgi:hypothetical protein
MFFIGFQRANVVALMKVFLNTAVCRNMHSHKLAGDPSFVIIYV